MDARAIFIRCVEERHSKHAEVASHCCAGIYFNFAAIADHYHSSKLREESQILSEIYVSEHLENEIDPGTACQRKYLIRVVGCVMIQDVVRTLLGNTAPPLFSSSGSDHRQTSSSRKLNRRSSNATGRSVDEDRLACLAVSLLKK